MAAKSKNESSVASSPSSVHKSDEHSTTEDLIENLTQKLYQKENVTDLVIVTMAFLPEQIPSIFHNSYKPVTNPGKGRFDIHESIKSRPSSFNIDFIQI